MFLSAWSEFEKTPIDASAPNIKPFVDRANDSAQSAALTELVENQVRFRFARIPGVAQVDVWGGYGREVRVELDPGRVNALDWDNVGTITHLHDTIGAASVQFTTSDGKHTRTRTMPWSDLKPIDHPEPAAIGEPAESYLDGIRDTIGREASEWSVTGQDAIQGC